MSELELLKRRFDRERGARKEAESLLEEKSRELFYANQQFRQLAEQTRAIVETAAEGILTYDSNGQVDSINRSARRIFGVDQDEDLNVNQLLQASDLQAILFHHSTESEEEIPVSVEIQGIRSSGKTFIAEIAVSSSQSGQSLIYTALVRDLSRRKKLEEELRQAKKMESVGQMAAGIAHEINTPIQFIGNNIQFLQGAFDDLGDLLDLYQNLTDTIKSNEEPTTLLEKIDTQSELADLPFLREEFPGAINQSLEGIEKVASLIRTMKEFSQPTSEGKTSVDINRLIENTLAVSTSVIRDVATVETSLDNSIPLTIMIEAKINQIIVNVLSNAIESIEESKPTEKGQIRIHTEMLGDSFEIQIWDNGPGIPTEIQDRIFDPFFSTKEVGKGTGQGLAFVYDVVVNKHGGTIRAESTPESGTTFFITFPIQPTDVTSSERREHAHTVR